MKLRRKSIGSLFLMLCMVLSILPTVAFANTSGSITAFAALDDREANQWADFGTAEEVLELPVTLSATLSTEDEEGRMTQTETTLIVSAWVCDAFYDSGTAGHYTFVPTLELPDGITLKEGISLPEITITVQEAEEEPLSFASLKDEPTTLPTVTPTTCSEVEAALKSTTASNIIIDDNFSINDTLVEVGANHTLSIASNKMVELLNGSVLTISEGIELTVDGGGTFACTYVNDLEDGTIVVNGSLNLNNITFQIFTKNNYINGTLTATDCNIIIAPQIKSSISLCINQNAVVDIYGGTLQVNASKANSYGTFSSADSPIQISDCKVTLSNSASGSTFLLGSYSFLNSAVDISRVSNSSGSGISFDKLTFDHSEVTLNTEINTTALEGNSADSALKIINGSKVNMIGTGGTGIHFSMEQTSTSNTIFIDNSVLNLKGIGANNLQLNGGTVVYGDNGGSIIFAEGSEVNSLPNIIKDRGVLVTKTGHISVTTAINAADSQKISAGTYTWNGTYFSNTTPTNVTFTAQQIGGESQKTNSTAIKLGFNQAVSNLTAKDITITADTSSAAKGALSGSGDTWSIALDDVAKEGKVTISIREFGDYSVTNNPQSVTLYSSNLPVDPDQAAVNTLADALVLRTWILSGNTQSDISQELMQIMELIIAKDSAYDNITVQSINTSNLYPATQSADGSVLFNAVVKKNGKTATTANIGAKISALLTTPTVSDVSISPSDVQVQKGKTQRFAATVTGTNNPAQKVTWELVGYSGVSTINSDYGILTVAADEPKNTLTVKATSTVDTSKFATATVSVVNEITTPIYGIDISDYDYGQLTEGYSVGGSTSVGIRNIGNQPTGEMLADLSNSYWKLGFRSTISSVAPGSSQPFYIEPTEGLTAGTYKTTLTVTGANSIITSADLTFTVVAAKLHTITFHPNGGNVTTPSAQTNRGGMLSSLPTPTRSGNYRFDGWFTQATGGEQITSSSIFAGNTTIYAHWIYTGGSGNNGGSSGNGGSGSSSTQKLITETNTTMTGPYQSATATVIATTGNGGIATASVQDKTITDAVAFAQSTMKKSNEITLPVVLNITIPKNTTALSAALTQTSLNSLINGGISSLEITGFPVTAKLDQKALKAIEAQSSGGIQFEITSAPNLSSAAKAMIGTRPVYNIRIISANDKSEISSLKGGDATISIPYTPTEDECIAGLHGVYVDEKGNATPIAGSYYDVSTASIVFTTTHFSLYGVGYTAPTAAFTDLTGHWGKESIDYVVGRRLLTGTTETTFSPNTATTRGTLVMALGKLANADIAPYTATSFTDVALGSTPQPYIEWAYKNKIISGTGNGKFEADRSITREEIAIIFSNYARATDYSLPQILEAATFEDYSNIGRNCQGAVQAMQKSGTMMGDKQNHFNPKANATRAEVSVMLKNYIQLTIDPKTAQGWAFDDNGQFLYYKDGSVFTGWQTIDNLRYFFNADGTLKTAWVQDGTLWRFYASNKATMGWQEIGGKWYYFNADGTMAADTTVDGYVIGKNGVRTA